MTKFEEEFIISTALKIKNNEPISAQPVSRIEAISLNDLKLAGYLYRKTLNNINW